MGKTVKEYAEEMARMSTGAAKRIYEYILLHGEYFEGATRSSILPRSALVGFLLKPRKKWCYYNAQMLTLLSGIWDIQYYEGVADNGIFVGAHAWNLCDGKVIDLTWEDIPREFPDIPDVRPIEKLQYFGVKLPRSYVREMNPVRTGRVQPLLLTYVVLEPRQLHGKKCRDLIL